MIETVIEHLAPNHTLNHLLVGNLNNLREKKLSKESEFFLVGQQWMRCGS